MRDRHEGESDWTEVPMVPLVNDRWRAEFRVTELGRYRFTIEAGVDPFETWRRQFAKRVEAGQDVAEELKVGAQLVDAAAASAHGPEAEEVTAYAAELRRGNVASLVRPSPDRSLSVTYGRQVEILVEPPRARHGAWYEMFPRSAGKEGKHGTFRDVEGWLTYISGKGFAVLYFPPIHPIGRTNRRGANTSARTQPDEPGTPRAIASQ